MFNEFNDQNNFLLKSCTVFATGILFLFWNATEIWTGVQLWKNAKLVRVFTSEKEKKSRFYLSDREVMQI